MYSFKKVFIIHLVNNLLNPVFRQIAFKGSNKTLYRADATGEFVLSFEGEDSKLCMIRNRISQIIFELLSDCGVANHYIKPHGMKEQKVVALEMLPFFVNVVGSTTDAVAKRLMCAPGMKLKNYLVELILKQNDNPVVSKEHIVSFDWIKAGEWEKIELSARRSMDIIYSFFKAFGFTVSAVCLEFGRMYKDGLAHDILLADEMSLQNIQLSIDDMVGMTEIDTYVEVAKRLGILKYE